MPDIRAGPTQFLGILPRTASELREAIGDILVILRQMGVQHHPLVPRKDSGIPHQLATDRERRTGRQPHPHHRPLARVVKGIHHPDAILKDRRLPLHQRIRRQAPGTLANAHRPPRRVKPQPHLRRRRDRVIQPRPVGEQIEMIRCHRAARKRQFRQPDLGRDEHFLRPETPPDRVKRLQPAEEQRILPPRHGPRQRLVQMVMRVHQSRRHHATRSLHHLARGRQALPQGGDDTPAQQHVAPGNLAPRPIHGDNRRRTPDQDLSLWHGNAPLSPTPFGGSGSAGDRRGKDSLGASPA